jgi:hypothetical protein
MLMEVADNDKYDYIIQYVNARDAVVKALSTEKPEPFRLVMVKSKDFCQFCPNPSGKVHFHWINVDNRFGFLSCTGCCEKGKAAIVDWFGTKAYGAANHLQDKEIKVLRSSGIVETDWVLDKSNPFVEEFEGCDYVHAIKSDNSIIKWCKLDELVELNK